MKWMWVMVESTWRFVHIGLIVTGRGEEEFVVDFLRQLRETGHCDVKILRFVGQRNPQSEKKRQKALAAGTIIPDSDEKIGLEIRRWLNRSDLHYAIWLDDLESAMRSFVKQKFERLRTAGDAMLTPVPECKNRYGVHFFVNMLEAYYFADIDAVNSALNLALQPHADDCENIRHPKNELKMLAGKGAFDEKADGARIVAQLNLETILSSPEHCRALRTLVAWCWEAIGEPRDERFHLASGQFWDVTAAQLQLAPDAAQVGTLGTETGYLPETSLPA
jgi:hypothetical protein